MDAIRRTDGIEWVNVRNEEAGASAAAAEAQLTGRLAVCAGSCGPGNTYLVQGLYDAHRSGAPVLPGDVLHRPAADPTGVSPPVSKATALPADEQVGALPRGSTPPDTVTLFCGAGVQGAHAEVTALAAKLHSSIGHALRGKEWIQYDNPHDVGMSGPPGYGACYQPTHEADLLLLLGSAPGSSTRWSRLVSRRPVWR